MSLLPIFLLAAWLGAAAWHDLRARRIPNAVVFSGALLAFALHALLPAGAGLFGTPMGALGLASSLGGWALGLVFLLPMYALRAMGAGDVKLLAMVGAFVGAGEIFTVTIAVLLAGGVLALAVAAWQRKLRSVVNNTLQTTLHAGLSGLHGGIAAPAVASGRLPYAIAITAGTLVALLLPRL